MRLRPLPVLLALLLSTTAARADEGLWTFDAFPADAVRKAYGWAPDAAWLDRVRQATFRLSTNCTAGVVSADGLLLTNQHCVRACLEDLSSAKQDLLSAGFLAAKPAEERRCAGMEATQLLETRDVTAQVHAATRGQSGAPFTAALRAEASRLEGACATSPEVSCQLVALHDGARYHLYKQRRFEDVRLVFAAEFGMAAFGGDPDNFHFPRYAFDVAFLRVYGGGRPLPTRTFLPWSRQAVTEGEVTLVPGYPAGTDRQVAVADLEHQRDVVLPYRLMQLAEQRAHLRTFAARSPEAARVSRTRLRVAENRLKASWGLHRALADGRILSAARAGEAELRRAVARERSLKEMAGAWDELARALAAAQPLFVEHRLKEGGEAFDTQLFGLARHLLRAADEVPRPSAERLSEYADARLPALRAALLRPSPVSRELEELTLAVSLTRMRELLGADDPFVQAVLGTSSPEALARTVVRGTRLDDVAVRRALLEGGRKAVDAAKDPLLELARKVDAEARAVRRRYEERVEAPHARAAERIGRARLQVRGTAGYPDATATLRLSYGAVAGTSSEDEDVPAFTSFFGALARHTGTPPFVLPRRWLDARERLPAEAPLNMASTHDIAEGSAGSPVLNRAGEVVGVVFDVNEAALGHRFGYVPEAYRAVSVQGEAVLTVLDAVYGARRLADELREGAARP